MVNARPIALIEADDRRRAAISHASAAAGLHIEPFETIGELHAFTDKCAILVHDTGAALAATLERCERMGYWLPVVAYSDAPSSTRVADAVFSGALDYIAWPFGPADIGHALERVGERGKIVGKRRAEAASAARRFQSLSGREHQVVAAMADGLTNKLIARRLEISPRTVEIHRANAIWKLGVSSSSEAIILAITAASRRA